MYNAKNCIILSQTFYYLDNNTKIFASEFLKKDTTQQQIVDAMLEQYDAPRKVIEKDVADTISKLRKIGAIDE